QGVFVGPDQSPATGGNGDRAEVRGRLECRGPLGGGPVQGFYRSVSAGHAQRQGTGSGGERGRFAPLRPDRNAGRRLLRRSGYGERASPADASLLRDEWTAFDAGPWRTLAAGDHGEVRLQEYQTNRPDPLHGRTVRGLLGGARLRLVRRAIAVCRLAFAGCCP